MNDSLLELVASILYCHSTGKYTTKVAKILLKDEGVSVNLKTCWTLNKAEVEYKNKLYTIEV